MANHPIEPHPVLAKIARALAESDARRFGVDAKSVAAWVQMQQSNYLPDARAALEALREPTPDMVEAGADAVERVNWAMMERDRSGSPEEMPDFDSGDVATASLTAMINTIIGESA